MFSFCCSDFAIREKFAFTFQVFSAPSCVSSVQFSAVPQSSLTLCDPMDYNTPGLPVHHNFQSLLKLISIESVMSPNHLILCHSLTSCLQSFLASGSFLMSSDFASGGQSIGTSASASISPSNKYSGLIYFMMNWFDLLTVQGVFSDMSSKASIFQCSAFFMVQLSDPYMTTGKTTALTIRTFVSKVMSLLLRCV